MFCLRVLYNWQWKTACFRRKIADPGEYGVESYYCRLLCCFVYARATEWICSWSPQMNSGLREKRHPA